MKPPEDNRSPGIIPPHGGYRDLKSCQMSEIVQDGTVVFCDRFIDRRSRTHDQLVQAARLPRLNQLVQKTVKDWHRIGFETC